MDCYITIPTIELIRRELCAAPAGALVETSVRTLARAIGRSAGQISAHLAQLEADGHIRRLSERRGTVIEVLRSDPPHDHRDQLHDHHGDQLHDHHPDQRPDHPRNWATGDQRPDHLGAPTQRSRMPNPLRAGGGGGDHAADRPAPPAQRSRTPNLVEMARTGGDHETDPPHTPLIGTGGGSNPTTPLPPTAPGGGGGGATPGTPNPDTVALLLGYNPPFSAASVREFGDLPPDVVRRELTAAKAAGSGPGAIVMRWRLQRPSAPAATPPPPRTPQPERRPAPADVLSPQEAARAFARLRQLQQQRLGVGDGATG